MWLGLEPQVQKHLECSKWLVIKKKNQLKNEWLFLEATFKIKAQKNPQQDGASSCLNSVAATVWSEKAAAGPGAPGDPSVQEEKF